MALDKWQQSGPPGRGVDTIPKLFWQRVRERFGDTAGSRFVAITDPGSPLDGLATQSGYRRVFRNAADIGGRYSALSLFGLVPAVLMGADIERLPD